MFVHRLRHRPNNKRRTRRAGGGGEMGGGGRRKHDKSLSPQKLEKSLLKIIMGRKNRSLTELINREGILQNLILPLFNAT